MILPISLNVPILTASRSGDPCSSPVRTATNFEALSVGKTNSAVPQNEPLKPCLTAAKQSPLNFFANSLCKSAAFNTLIYGISKIIRESTI